MHQIRREYLSSKLFTSFQQVVSLPPAHNIICSPALYLVHQSGLDGESNQSHYTTSPQTTTHPPTCARDAFPNGDRYAVSHLNSKHSLHQLAMPTSSRQLANVNLGDCPDEVRNCVTAADFHCVSVLRLVDGAGGIERAKWRGLVWSGVFVNVGRICSAVESGHVLNAGCNDVAGSSRQSSWDDQS